MTQPGRDFMAHSVRSVGTGAMFLALTRTIEDEEAVKSIVELKTGEIKKAITEQVDSNFKKDAITFAVKQLSERLGLAK